MSKVFDEIRDEATAKAAREIAAELYIETELSKKDIVEVCGITIEELNKEIRKRTRQ